MGKAEVVFAKGRPLPEEFTGIVFRVKESPRGSYTARAQGHALVERASSLDALRQRIEDCVRRQYDGEPGAPRRVRVQLVLDLAVNA